MIQTKKSLLIAFMTLMPILLLVFFFQLRTNIFGIAFFNLSANSSIVEIFNNVEVERKEIDAKNHFVFCSGDDGEKTLMIFEYQDLSRHIIDLSKVIDEEDAYDIALEAGFDVEYITIILRQRTSDDILEDLYWIIGSSSQDEIYISVIDGNLNNSLW